MMNWSFRSQLNRERPVLAHILCQDFISLHWIPVVMLQFAPSRAVMILDLGNTCIQWLWLMKKNAADELKVFSFSSKVTHKQHKAKVTNVTSES